MSIEFSNSSIFTVLTVDVGLLARCMIIEAPIFVVLIVGTDAFVHYVKNRVDELYEKRIDLVYAVILYIAELLGCAR